MEAQQDISIIVPCYNPESRIFSRCLDAIAALDRSRVDSIECLIIDNNSSSPLEELDFVIEFLRNCPWARVVVEKRQGLTFARLAGIRESRFSTLVVFDDDNEPAPNYLEVVDLCRRRWTSVGIWGAGNIRVELLDPVPEHLAGWIRRNQNERRVSSVEFGLVPGAWCDFYPIGMGQVMVREVADSYLEAVESGEVSSTDRCGKSLASGGDVQLVWTALKLGYAAGVHPEMRINHLIPSRRTEGSYIRRLNYGCAVSFLPALVESFPEELERVQRTMPGTVRVLGRLIRLAMGSMRGRVQGRKDAGISKYLGEVVGHYRAVEADPGWLVAKLVRLLGLE
jgi:glycosyltransferase involved in cell wall biosynthesis